MKIKLLLILFLVPIMVIAQDIHFSQFFNTAFFTNPGLAGNTENSWRFSGLYKQQWTSISSNPYKTIMSSADGIIYKDKIGAGLMFYSDKAGDAGMGITQVDLSIAPRIRLNAANQLILGLQAGFAQRSISINNLTWDSQFDGSGFNQSYSNNEIASVSNFNYADFSSGLIWKYKSNQLKFETGISAYHLTSPDFSYYSTEGENLFRKMIVQTKAEITPDKNKNVTLIPMILYMDQGPSSEMNFGMLVKYDLGMNSIYTGLKTSSALYLGLVYRNKDALIVSTGYDYIKKALVTFSYDINVSKLRSVSHLRGGPELSIIYYLSKKNVTVKTVPKSSFQ